jgi:hypothetical protein
MLASRSVTVRQTWCTPVMTGPFGVLIFSTLIKPSYSAVKRTGTVFHWPAISYRNPFLTGLDLAASSACARPRPLLFREGINGEISASAGATDASAGTCIRKKVSGKTKVEVRDKLREQNQLDLAAASSRLEARLRYGRQGRARSATSAGSGR